MKNSDFPVSFRDSVFASRSSPPPPRRKTVFYPFAKRPFAKCPVAPDYALSAETSPRSGESRPAPDRVYRHVFRNTSDQADWETSTGQKDNLCLRCWLSGGNQWEILRVLVRFSPVRIRRQQKRVETGHPCLTKKKLGKGSDEKHLITETQSNHAGVFGFVLKPN